MNSRPDTSDEPDRDGRCDPDPPCKPCAPDPDDCDSKSIAIVRCRAVGIEKQAEFNKEYQPPLDAAQETYASTRSTYRETRASIACDVRDLKHDISCLIKRIRCLIKQEHVVECLDDSFDCIVGELKKCDKPRDELDCDYDDDCDHVPLEVITQRIVEYKAKLEAAKAHFGWLAGEPERLGKRFEDAEAEVKAVEAALKADPAVTDPKKLYVQAIVAWYHLKHVYGRFRTVSDFIDALCEALTCWRTGVVAVSELVRREAVLKCHLDAKEKECERLRSATIDEILVVYERLCKDTSCDEGDDDDYKYTRDKSDECDDGDDGGHDDDSDDSSPSDDDHGDSSSHKDDDDRDGKSEKRRGGGSERYRSDRDDDMDYRRR